MYTLLFSPFFIKYNFDKRNEIKKKRSNGKKGRNFYLHFIDSKRNSVSLFGYLSWLSNTHSTAQVVFTLDTVFSSINLHSKRADFFFFVYHPPSIYLWMYQAETGQTVCLGKFGAHSMSGSTKFKNSTNNMLFTCLCIHNSIFRYKEKRNTKIHPGMQWMNRIERRIY